MNTLEVPHPIAILRIRRSAFPGNTPVISFVPADGVEDEPVVRHTAIMQGLAVDDVVGQLVNELRGQRIQCFRVMAVGQAKPVQGTRDAGQINRGLSVGELL